MRNWHFILGLIAFSLGIYNFILTIAFFVFLNTTQLYVLFGFLGSIAWLVASLISFINTNQP